MDKKLEESLGQEFTFDVQRIAREAAEERAVRIRASRWQLQRWDELKMRTIFRGVLDIACKNDEVFYYPDGWWQAFKEEVLKPLAYRVSVAVIVIPHDTAKRWIEKHLSGRRKAVWAVWKFPEIDLPSEVLGRRFVSFRVVDEEKLNASKQG